jgi:chaperone protein EcpD
MSTALSPSWRRRSLAALCLTTMVAWQSSVQAALTMSTTRVVYEGDRRGVSLIVANPSKGAFAVQAWVNTQEDDTTSAVPFVVTPALFRLDPAKQQQVRISGLPNQLPTDRESLFYFNLQEIPQVDASHQNVLAIALRTRIKLFYRPAVLKEGPAHQQTALKWSVVEHEGKKRLAVDNPTPYHVTFSRLMLHGKGEPERLEITRMIAPLSRQYYDVSSSQLHAPLRVEFATINDYGGASQPLSVPVAL